MRVLSYANAINKLCLSIESTYRIIHVAGQSAAEFLSISRVLCPII